MQVNQQILQIIFFVELRTFEAGLEEGEDNLSTMYTLRSHTFATVGRRGSALTGTTNAPAASPSADQASSLFRQIQVVPIARAVVSLQFCLARHSIMGYQSDRCQRHAVSPNSKFGRPTSAPIRTRSRDFECRSNARLTQRRLPKTTLRQTLALRNQNFFELPTSYLSFHLCCVTCRRKRKAPVNNLYLFSVASMSPIPALKVV